MLNCAQHVDLSSRSLSGKFQFQEPNLCKVFSFHVICLCVYTPVQLVAVLHQWVVGSQPLKKTGPVPPHASSLGVPGLQSGLGCPLTPVGSLKQWEGFTTCVEEGVHSMALNFTINTNNPPLGELQLSVSEWITCFFESCVCSEWQLTSLASS